MRPVALTVITVAVVMIFLSVPGSLSLISDTLAQSPPIPPDVQGDQLRAAMAELKAEMAATRAETKALVADKEKQKNAELERSLAREKRRQANLATLAVERGEVQNEMKQASQTTLEALQKRNAELENKIKKANRTFACRVLSLGCVRVRSK